jgi:hypothetical protein
MTFLAADRFAGLSVKTTGSRRQRNIRLKPCRDCYRGAPEAGLLFFGQAQTLAAFGYPCRLKPTSDQSITVADIAIAIAAKLSTNLEQVLNVNLTKQAIALWKKNIQSDFCSLATAKIEFYLIYARLTFTSI